MNSQITLFSIGNFDFKLNHIFIIGVLSLSFSTSFLIRSLPAEYGWELHEYDPFFNYRATEYLLNNGLEKYLNWNDSLSWYPFGRDISSNSQVILHITTATTYSIFGGNIDLYDFSIIFPAVIGSLTCVVIFALTRVLFGTTSGLFASLFFSISLPILVRGQIGWLKSEPLGLFYGLLGMYFLLSGIKSNNSSSYIRVIFGGIFTSIGISAWGGNFFFLVPVSILFCLLPFFRKDGDFLLKSIPLFTSSVMISGLFFERLTAGLVFGISGILLILATSLLVGIILIQKRTRRKTRNAILFLISILVISSISLIIAEDFQITQLPSHRYLNAIYPLLTTSDPLTDSVSEHGTLTLSQSFVFHSVLMIFASIGIWIIMTKNSKFKNPTNDMKLFALSLGLFGVYIGSAFMRLEVFTSVGIIILSSIGVSLLLKSSIIKNKKFNAQTLVISSLIFVMLMIPLFLPVDGNVIAVSAKTPPTITNGGTFFTVSTNDWREALEWIKYNTPENSVIGSWWDYGYWIQTISNRFTLTDNSTLIDHRIKSIAKIFFETPDDAWKSLREMETDYFIIFISAQKLPYETLEYEELYFLQGGGDESKKFWFAKIAGVNSDDYFYNDLFSGNDNFWNNTFLGKIIPYKVYGYADLQNDQFSTNYVPGWIGLYTKEQKFVDDNQPFHLVYQSPSNEKPIDNKIIGIFVYKINPDYIPISEDWNSPILPLQK